MSHQDVKIKLDQLVNFRGELAHRGEKYQSRRVVKPGEADDAKKLIEHLVASTAKSLGRFEWETVRLAEKEGNSN